MVLFFSRAPGLTSGLQGSMNVHRGVLYCWCHSDGTSSFVFYIYVTKIGIYVTARNCMYIPVMIHQRKSFTVVDLRVLCVYCIHQRKWLCSFYEFMAIKLIHKDLAKAAFN